MSKIVRNVIAILLCVTGLILLVLPASGLQAAGTLHGDFEMDGTTLVSYKGREANLTLPDMITRIGKDAFSGNVSLRNVIIPDGVKEIDYAAFENCSNLLAVSIPGSVKTIGSSAFSGCTSLSSVNIPEKVKSIGSGTFAGCSSLSNVDISASNPYFVCQDGVIYSGDGSEVIQYLAGRGSTTYSMPESIDKIREYAFWGANNLTGVSISSRVKEIPEYAFSNCAGLSSIILPASVSSIQAYAFSDCVNLRSAVIPMTVGYIDDLAFYMSNGVTVQFTDSTGGIVSEQVPSSSANSSSENSTAGSSSTGNDSANDLSDTSTQGTDNTYVTNHSDYEQNITPGEIGSTKLVGDSAIFLISPKMEPKGYNLSNAELEDGISASSNHTTTSSDEFSAINGILNKYNGAGGDVSVPSEIIKIGNRSFYKNPTINSVSISGNIDEIGDFAFARSSISSITISNGTKKIGYASFYNCENLSDVYIPDSVETIELGAFLGTPYLNDWFNTPDGNNYLTVGDGILLSYKGDGGNITIPEGIKTIAPGCFSGNISITGVTFPTTLKTIGEDSFNGCSKLNTLSMPAGVETIEDRAFQGTSLTTLSIPPSVKSIGLGAFDLSSSDSLDTVLFLGSEIPNVSYKPTASRLSARDLRIPAFNGIDNAVIRDTADINSGNLFDTDYLGFRGSVYNISGDSSKGQNTLNLVYCTKEPDESGIVSIDPHVKLGNTDYIMSGVMEHALDAYKDDSSWYKNELNDVIIMGNTSSGLEDILASIPEKASVEYSEDNAISVTLSGNGFPQNSTGKAVISGNREPYNLYISEDNNSLGAIKAAFINSYGFSPTSVYPMDITLKDNTDTIEIHKLNTDKIEITMPVPTYMIGSDDLGIIALDDNGALEMLTTVPESIDGTQALKFIAGHFSTYAIVHADEVNNLGNATDYLNASGNIDPDSENVEMLSDSLNIFTLNATNNTITKGFLSFSPLCIIGIIFVCSGIVLLFFNKKRSKNKVN